MILNQNLTTQWCRLTAVWLLMACSLPIMILAQQTRHPTPQSNDIPWDDLRRAHGTVLTEGANTAPVGPLKVKTFRLEEVAMPRRIELDLGAGLERVEAALRLTITGESFLPGEYVIWVGGTPLTGVSDHPRQLSVVIINPRVLKQGAPLSVSYDTFEDDPEGRTYLPELLELPAKYQHMSLSANPWKILSLHRVSAVEIFKGQPGIEIVIAGNMTFVERNASLVMNIGKEEFSPTG